MNKFYTALTREGVKKILRIMFTISTVKEKLSHMENSRKMLQYNNYLLTKVTY